MTDNNTKNLDDWLEAVQVGDADDDHNEANDGKLAGVLGWYYVSTDDGGAIAYFTNEADAFRFRLDYINRKMNP